MNVNVLKITSTPIKLSITSERARLEVQAPESEAMAVSDTRGQLNMKTQNIKVEIDSSRTQNGMEYQNPDGATYQAAQTGLKAAQRAAARYAKPVVQAQTEDGSRAVENVKNQMLSQAKVTTGSVTPETVEIPGLAVAFTPRNVETKAVKEAGPSTEYVPGELNISVEQYPKVEIEYVGGPIYFPRSANPEYQE